MKAKFNLRWDEAGSILKKNCVVLTLVMFALLITGCAVQSVAVKGESIEPTLTKSIKIAVVENPSLDTFVSSVELKEDLSTVLEKEGFQVAASEAEADMVVLPLATIVSSDEVEDGSVRTSRSSASSLLFKGSFDEIGDPSVSRRLGVSRLDSSEGLAKSRVGMSVTAISKSTWTDMKPGEDLPIIWGVVAMMDLTRGRETESPKTLLNAMGAYFGKQTDGFVSVTINTKK
jgi:hypothetical protein